MMGRLCGPDCASRSGAAFFLASSPWARVPTPAATAPRTEVLTKSRRAKVIFLLLVWKREEYHAAATDFCGADFVYANATIRYKPPRHLNYFAAVVAVHGCASKNRSEI